MFFNRSSDIVVKDLLSGLVVFLVALPLCLGIALASGVPLLSGMIAGVIGGLVVTSLSRSELAVSGPAAGLVAVVVGIIADIGYQGLLLCTVLAGVLQVIMGSLKLSKLAHYVPQSVVKGMLTAIGITICYKQIPIMIGHTSWKALSITDISSFIVPICIISVMTFVSHMLYNHIQNQLPKPLNIVPAALIAVIVGTLTASILGVSDALYMVSLPSLTSIDALKQALVLPDIALLNDGIIYKHTIVLALIASLETLLTIQAVDSLDPQKRTSPLDRELIAQGTGNVLSGMIGGLPITAVIARSGALISSGGTSRLVALTQAVLLLVSLIALSSVLSYIPLAALAVVLFLVGVKLASPEVFLNAYKTGMKSFLSFIITVIAVLMTDLLIGVIIGIIAFYGLSTVFKERIRYAEQ